MICPGAAINMPDGPEPWGGLYTDEEEPTSAKMELEEQDTALRRTQLLLGVPPRRWQSTLKLSTFSCGL